MKNPARLLLLVLLSTLAADQVSKYLAVSRLTLALGASEGLERVGAFLSEKNLDNDPREPGRFSQVMGPYRLVDDYWHFRYVENPGAAWGLLGTLPASVRRPFFHVVSLSALAFILMMFLRLKPEERMERLALALVAGGALGNFVDRLLRGYVIDFIDWHWRNQPGLHWPTFNVADAAICAGVGLMLLEGLRVRKPESVTHEPRLV